MSANLPVISLFSGAGGLDLAVEKVAEPPLVQDGTKGPLRVAVATDYDVEAVETFRLNFEAPIIKANITKTTTDQILDAGEPAACVPSTPSRRIRGRLLLPLLPRARKFAAPQHRVLDPEVGAEQAAG